MIFSFFSFFIFVFMFIKFFIFVVEDIISKVFDVQFIFLDSCIVKVEFILDLLYERLELFIMIMNEFNMKIEGIQIREGLVISSECSFQDRVKKKKINYQFIYVDFFVLNGCRLFCKYNYIFQMLIILRIIFWC